MRHPKKTAFLFPRQRDTATTPRGPQHIVVDTTQPFRIVRGGVTTTLTTRCFIEAKRQLDAVYEPGAALYRGDVRVAYHGEPLGRDVVSAGRRVA
jgi:hypothetical protein